MAATVGIEHVLGSSWSELSRRVKALRDQLFGQLPDMGPVDIGSISVPENVLSEIREKNRRRVRDEISVEEMTAEGSPYRTDAYFDDQLLEVIASIEDEYEPADFIRQMVHFIEKFLNESAAFRTGVVATRLEPGDGEQAVELVRAAIERAQDADTRHTLELLLLDLTNGGDEPWVAELPEASRSFVRSVIEQQQRR